MRENRDIKLSEVLEELYGLREENQQLKVDNDFLQKQNAACKMRFGKYALQIQELESEIADLKFTNKCLTPESSLKNLPKKYIHHIDETTIIQAPDDLVEALAEIGGFQVYEVIGYNDEHEGYTMELINDEFVLAEHASQQMEDELVSAMGSYLGDDF